MKYANRIMWSDCHAYEVIKLEGKKASIRRLKAKLVQAPKDFRVGGFVACVVDNHDQKWEFEPNTNELLLTIRLHKDGFWYTSNGMKFELSDKPVEFHDYNF